MNTTDEFGTRWLVKAGDPAMPFINLLKRRGFEIVVLPRLCYTSGNVPTPPDFEPGDVVLAARLDDCIGALNE